MEFSVHLAMSNGFKERMETSMNNLGRNKKDCNIKHNKNLLPERNY